MNETHVHQLTRLKRGNTVKSFLLMGSFLVAIVFLGLVIAHFTGNFNYFYIAFFAALAMNFVGYFFSSSIALSTARAVVADEQKYAELHAIVETLSQKEHIPKPAIYVINDPGPNAFATGRNEHHAAIAVTTGLLAMMNKSELEGVIAHELSHIRNKDILIMTLVVVFAGTLSMLAQLVLNRSLYSDTKNNNQAVMLFLGLVASIVLPIAATLIQLSISRKREFMADASGVLSTGYPEGLASALEKIGTFKQPLQHATPSTAHLYISSPFGTTEKQGSFQKLFMTHPPLEERIHALRPLVKEEHTQEEVL